MPIPLIGQIRSWVGRGDVVQRVSTSICIGQAVFVRDVLGPMFRVRRIPSALRTLPVIQNYVGVRTPPLGIIVSRRTDPSDLTPEVLRAEYRVKGHLEVVAGCGVAVKIQRAGWLEDPAQFDQSSGHHDEVSENVVVTQQAAESL